MTEPWKPAPYEPEDVGAIRALANGTCPEHQQQRALKWIVETVCGAYDLSYRPSSERDSAFAEGKRFVGLQIIKLTKLPIPKPEAKHVGPTGGRKRGR